MHSKYCIRVDSYLYRNKHYQKDGMLCARCFSSCWVYINKCIHNMSGGMCHEEEPNRSEDKSW